MTELIPVLELEPASYATHSHASPCVSALEDVAGWDAYWRASLADSGITDLTPWRRGSWNVPLTEFSASETLRTVLRHELRDAPDWDLDHIGPLSGGYILVHEGIVMEPGCCGDFGNLADWMRAAECTSETWEMLWIGHPWSHVRATGDDLHIAEPSEESETSPGLRDLIVLPRAALVAAIEGAKQTRARFRAALATIVAERVPRARLDAILDVLTFDGQQ
jgi:hypothetical protein